MKFVLLIRSLGRAGTEVQAKNLASGLRSAGHHVCVVTFYSGGFYEAELSTSDIEVINLGKRGRWHVLGFFRAWIRVLIEKKPDVVYSFLTGANLVAVVARVIRRKTRVYWGMRTAAPDGSYGKADLFGRIEFWISRYAVRLVHGVVCNSHAGYHFLKSNGVPISKLVIIGNGIDTDFFYRDRSAARSILEEHSLPEGKKLIGTVARLSPSKGHRMFIEAAARYLEKWGDAHFLIVGGGSSRFVSAGDTGYEAELRQLAENLGIGARLSWLGERTDMPRIYSALTVNTLCSQSIKILTVADQSDRNAKTVSLSVEAVSNSLLEAMACETPCVATDVGDTKKILDTVGVVVHEKDIEGLVQGWRSVISRLEQNEDEYRSILRDRVIKDYSMQKMIDKTLSFIAR